MPDGPAAVWRTHDRGDSWIRADDGLPTRTHSCRVLREAMARDTLDPGRDHLRDEDRPALAQHRRGRVLADDHRHLPEIWAVETWSSADG